MAQPAKFAKGRFWINLLLSILILSAGYATASYLRDKTTKPPRKQPQAIKKQVQVKELTRRPEQITIQAMGTVMPAREIILKSRVSGSVVSVTPDFSQGGLFRGDQTILRIDPQDYQLALAKAKSRIVEAQYNLKLELGHQEVARQEWQLLSRGDNKSDDDADLALRKPHLEKARADLAAAQADLKQAQLNLSRTRIQAPFNALVRQTHVALGSQVSIGENLATVAGTDHYWIKAALPANRLRWIDIPRKDGDAGAPATIFYAGGQVPGRVIRLLGGIQSQGRMAQILVEVSDPLGLTADDSTRQPLLIDEYVTIDIAGKTLENAVRIPRTALRENNQIWIVGPDDTLIIREIDPIWRGKSSVLVQDGIEDGELLITSTLSAPVNGMSINISERL